MKPSYHPEFFRLPPPAGASRESSIVLTADGRFYHDGAEVTHPGMAKAFATWIARHPDDGRYKTVAHMDGSGRLLGKQIALTQRPGDTGGGSSATCHYGAAEYEKVDSHSRYHRQHRKPVSVLSPGLAGAEA